MRFGIGIPQFYSDGGFDGEEFRRYLLRAEELGFESGWTQEQVLGTSSQLSALETMTYAAACTQRLRLGCAVFVSTLHSPVHLAKSLSTLDQLSGGRLEIGLGHGGRRPFGAFRADPERYIARFTEGIALMKALWTDERVTFTGDFWQLENAAMAPKPFQKPYPRIWMGGSADAALRRAVRLGDGFFGAGSSPTARFAEQGRHGAGAGNGGRPRPGDVPDREARLRARRRRHRPRPPRDGRRPGLDLRRPDPGDRGRRRHRHRGRLRARRAGGARRGRRARP